KRKLQQFQDFDSTSVSKPKMTKAIAKLVCSEQARQRELRRQRQVQYRKKKDKYEKDLAEEICRLRQEIGQLELQLRAVSCMSAKINSDWAAVAEYFRLFRYGITTSSAKAQPNFHEAFTSSKVTSNCAINTQYGPEAIIRTWRSLCEMFADVELELKSLEKEDVGTLVAATRTSATITEHTLRTAFPHLRHGKNVTVTEKLLGRRISVRSTMIFLWDPTHRRISSVMTQSDLLTPMLRLFRSLENVSDVYEGAMLSLDFQLKTDP
ncbi:hypothetical protein L917_20759, partial [Phytophthora nicotianae]